MLKLPSLQREYTVVFSRDPALDLPDPPEIDREKSSPDELAVADRITKERQHKLKVARETGNWTAITKEGQRPTIFRLRQVTGHALSWFTGEVDRNSLNTVESLELMCRVALVGVDNCGAFEVKHDPREADRPQLVSVSTIDTLYSLGQDQGRPSLGRELVMELGALAQERAVMGCPPLS